MAEKNMGIDPPPYETKSRPLLAVSVLLLSLLLCGSVTAFIVMSAHQTTTSCVQERPTATQPGQTVSANVNVKIDGKMSKEKVEYEEESKVSVVHTPDGSVTITDHKKGIAYIKEAGSSECFAIATGERAAEGTDLGDYLAHYNGQELYEETASNMSVNILPGYIEDTSFIPRQAKERCSKFRWMAATNGNEVQSQPGDRSKRDLRCTWYDNRLYIFLVRDRATGRFLYTLFVRRALCLDTDAGTTATRLLYFTRTPSPRLG